MVPLRGRVTDRRPLVDPDPSPRGACQNDAPPRRPLCRCLTAVTLESVSHPLDGLEAVDGSSADRVDSHLHGLVVPVVAHLAASYCWNCEHVSEDVPRSTGDVLSQCLQVEPLPVDGRGRPSRGPPPTRSVSRNREKPLLGLSSNGVGGSGSSAICCADRSSIDFFRGI